MKMIKLHCYYRTAEHIINPKNIVAINSPGDPNDDPYQWGADIQIDLVGTSIQVKETVEEVLALMERALQPGADGGGLYLPEFEVIE